MDEVFKLNYLWLVESGSECGQMWRRSEHFNWIFEIGKKNSSPGPDGEMQMQRNVCGNRDRSFCPSVSLRRWHLSSKSNYDFETLPLTSEGGRSQVVHSICFGAGPNCLSNQPPKRSGDLGAQNYSSFFFFLVFFLWKSRNGHSVVMIREVFFQQ